LYNSTYAFGRPAPGAGGKDAGRPPAAPAIRRAAVVLIALLASVLAAKDSAAASARVRVAGMEVRGLRTMSEAEFFGKIKIRQGDEYTQEAFRSAVAEAVRALAEDRLAVKVTTEEVREGEVIVVFTVLGEQKEPEIAEIVFEGLSAGRVRHLVQSTKGERLREYQVTDDRQRVREYLVDEGYADAIVRTRVEEVGPGQVRLVFEASRGAKLKLKKLVFVGNEGIERKELLRAMGTKEYTFFTRRPFVKGVFIDDVARIELLYQSRGYLDAHAAVEELTTDLETGHVQAAVRIAEGPRYRISEVKFEGNEAVSDAVLLGLIEMRPGAHYSLESLQNDISKVLRYYKTGGRGFALATVESRQDLGDEPATIKLSFEISEGRHTYIRRIETRGNFKTRKKVIVREMRIEPGDLYDIELIENSRIRLLDTQYFLDVKIEEQPAPPPRIGAVPDADYVDLVVSVEETETGRLMVGVGYSSNAALIGQISVEQRNFDISNLPNFKRYGPLGALSPDRAFVGGGQRLRLSAMPGTEYERYYFEFEEPWLFDYPVSFGLSGYLFQRRYDGWNIERLGGTVSLGRRFGRDFLVSLQYRRELVNIGGIDANSPIEAVRQEGDHDLGAWRISATYDTRDSILLPTRGGQYFTYGELGGGPAGGNVGFWKWGVRGEQNFKLWEFPEDTPHVLRLSMEAGLGGPAFGDDELPIFERYFAGGVNSMRGFAFRGIGPRQTVPATGDSPVGGEFLFLGSSEYIIPLYKRDLQGYIFTDVGTVSSGIAADAFDELRVSTGVGFRYLLPVMGKIPITVSFGFPLKKEPGDERQTFLFALGLFF